MGWAIVFAMGPLVSKLPHTGIVLLVVGGALYTFGAIFYVWRKLPYHHAIFHLFVLAGSILHFLCILLYVLPIR
jgi:hemolysin III